MKYKAFIFDLNGTLIDDMRFHTKAWHQLLNEELGAALTMEEVAKEMYGKNEEVLDRIFGAERFSAEEKKAISVQKEQKYQAAFLPHLRLVNGLGAFLEKAHQKGVSMAIGTAAIPFNVDFVIDHLPIRNYFKAIITAEDVTLSKPHPETFLKAAGALGVPPSECLVFEDVPKGAEAAANAGMDTVIVTTGHQHAEFAHLNRILCYIRDFTDPVLNALWN